MMNVELTEEQVQLLRSLLQDSHPAQSTSVKAESSTHGSRLLSLFWGATGILVVVAMLMMTADHFAPGIFSGMFQRAGFVVEQATAPTAVPVADPPRQPDAQPQAPVTINVITAPTAAPVPTPDTDSSDPAVPALPIGERPNLNPGPAAAPLETNAQSAPVVRERATQRNRPGERANQNVGPGGKP